MKWTPLVMGAVTCTLLSTFPAHAGEAVEGGAGTTAMQLSRSGMNREMDQAINLYLEKYPPTEITKLLYAALERSQPTALPEAARRKAISLFKENITPEIMAKMISAGLKRHFTVNEIEVLSEYEESQLSDEMKRKNREFRFDISSEIRLLLAASSG